MDKLKYISNFVNPDADDTVLDTFDVRGESYRQYKCDSILTTIGTPECKNNIRLFLNEIETELDDDAKKMFYYDVGRKIIEVYGLDVLEDHIENMKHLNYNLSINKLLLWSEINCVSFLTSVLKTVDMKILFNYKDLFEYLKTNFSKLEKIINKEVKKDTHKVPYLVKYFFHYGQLTNRCFYIVKTCTLNRHEVTTDIIGGSEK
jgi:hypothetical protein